MYWTQRWSPQSAREYPVQQSWHLLEPLHYSGPNVLYSSAFLSLPGWYSEGSYILHTLSRAFTEYWPDLRSKRFNLGIVPFCLSIRTVCHGLAKKWWEHKKDVIHHSIKAWKFMIAQRSQALVKSSLVYDLGVKPGSVFLLFVPLLWVIWV